MAKRPKSDGVQLSLDLEIRDSEAKPSSAPKLAPRNHNVVGFVDASTRAARQDAIKRVQQSGIFPAPPGPRLKA